MEPFRIPWNPSGFHRTQFENHWYKNADISVRSWNQVAFWLCMSVLLLYVLVPFLNLEFLLLHVHSTYWWYSLCEFVRCTYLNSFFYSLALPVSPKFPYLQSWIGREGSLRLSLGFCVVIDRGELNAEMEQVISLPSYLIAITTQENLLQFAVEIQE